MSASTTVNLPLSAAIELSSTVGNQTPAGTIVPVPTATVSVSVPDLGVVLVAGTNSSGKVSFLLPGTLPSPSTYCVGSSAPGYTSVNICGYAPSSLATLTHLLMPIDRVPVTVTVVGLPSSTSLTLNLTARSSTAINTTAVGSSPFTFQATPGTYELTGFAPLTGFRGLYMPPVGFTITVVPGAGPQSYTLTILRQVSSVGQISAPSPVTAANVTLIFSNQVTNFTLNGATFEHQFYAPAGSYSVYSSATVNNRTYAGLQNVTINATNGAISQTISLSSSITETTFELEQPGAIGVNATLPVTILGPGGTRINTTASVGNASVTLPSNGTYSIALNATALLSVNGLGEYRVLSVPAGYTCAVSGTNKTCVVPLNAVTLRTPVTGSVTLGGAATSFGGTLQLLGPNGTIATIPITNGAFRSSVLPGTYTALVTAGTYGLNYANLTTLTVQAISGPPLSIPLAPTWTDIVTVRPPAQGLTGPVTLSFISSSGTRLNYTNEPINQAVPVILPTGVYSIRATASTTPYGVQTTAVANATVSLINGNSATNLVLVPTFVSSASVRVVAPTSVLLGTGGSATFGYVVRNTGNVPEALTMKGSPATLVFSFDPLSFTLGVGASVGGYVTIFVPYGTAVAHPAIVLEAMLTNGTVAGTTGTSNGPTVSLTPFPALKVGTSGVAPTITATSVSVPFFVANPGNAQETVNVTIADKARLNSFGWSVELLSGTTASNGNLNLSASSNQTLSVLLTATTPNPLPPQVRTDLGEDRRDLPVRAGPGDRGDLDPDPRGDRSVAHGDRPVHRDPAGLPGSARSGALVRAGDRARGHPPRLPVVSHAALGAEVGPHGAPSVLTACLASRRDGARLVAPGAPRRGAGLGHGGPRGLRERDPDAHGEHLWTHVRRDRPQGDLPGPSERRTRRLSERQRGGPVLLQRDVARLERDRPDHLSQPGRARQPVRQPLVRGR